MGYIPPPMAVTELQAKIRKEFFGIKHAGRFVCNIQTKTPVHLKQFEISKVQDKERHHLKERKPE